MAQIAFHIADGVDGNEEGEQTDDDEKETGQEVEPQMKRQVGETDLQNDLCGLAACHGPDARCRGEEGGKSGKKKTECL